MVTDPPYGVEYDPSWRQKAGGGKGVATGKVANDHEADWRQTWALFPGKVCYIYHGGLHQAEVTASLRAVRFSLRAQIVWVKHRPAFSRGNFHWQHEPLLLAAAEDVSDEELAAQMDAGAEEVEGLMSLDHAIATYAVRDGESAEWVGGRKQSTVWFIEHSKNTTGHGTQKPVECMRRPILNNSRPGDAVYEPFSGSGSTLIAAESTGRRCYAIELMPGYVDVAVRRWEEFTGREAVLEEPNGKGGKRGKKRATFAETARARASEAASESEPAAGENREARPRRGRRSGE
jgi:site-specific DNA-methyltransferase (adenine-specific)